MRTTYDEIKEFVSSIKEQLKNKNHKLFVDGEVVDCSGITINKNIICIEGFYEDAIFFSVLWRKNPQYTLKQLEKKFKVEGV